MDIEWLQGGHGHHTSTPRLLVLTARLQEQCQIEMTMPYNFLSCFEWTRATTLFRLVKMANHDEIRERDDLREHSLMHEKACPLEQLHPLGPSGLSEARRWFSPRSRFVRVSLVSSFQRFIHVKFPRSSTSTNPLHTIQRCSSTHRRTLLCKRAP